MAAKKKTDLIALAFEMIVENGWQQLTMSKLAERGGMKLSELYTQLPGKSHIIGQFARRMDAATFNFNLAEMADLSPRDRLFDVIMRRFDALGPYKPAFVEINRRREMDCLAAVCLFCQMDKFAGRLLDVCDKPFKGVRQRFARRLLMAAYAKVFAVWLSDESEDLAATMAELDKRLGQLEQLARFSSPFGGFGRRCRVSPASESLAA